MIRTTLARLGTFTGLAVLSLASAGCDNVESQILDTVFFGLRIADIWV